MQKINKLLNLEYWEVLRLDAVLAHKRVIDCYFHAGERKISKTARLCGISRPTVRKWLRRFFAEGEAGLRERSRRPHRMPRKTSDEVERLVLMLREKTNYGARRIARALWQKYRVKLSYGTVQKILKRNNVYISLVRSSRFVRRGVVTIILLILRLSRN